MLWFQHDSVCEWYLWSGCVDAKERKTVSPKMIIPKAGYELDYNVQGIHTFYGHSLADVVTNNNTLWTTTQPAKCHLSTDRNQVSQMCLWFNQLKQEDCYIILVKHPSWIAGERGQTVHLDFNATTSAQTFIFSSFKQHQWPIVSPLKCHGTTKAKCTIMNIHTHVCIWRVHIHTVYVVFWLIHVKYLCSDNKNA